MGLNALLIILVAVVIFLVYSRKETWEIVCEKRGYRFTIKLKTRMGLSRSDVAAIALARYPTIKIIKITLL